MKYIIIITLFIYANSSTALVIWPGTTAPCNSTLDACADGSPDGQVIEIRTDAVIGESVITLKAISFKAGIGYKPKFQAGTVLQITNFGTVDRTVSVEGLTFVRGGISFFDVGSGDANTTLNIKNNHILDNSLEADAIRILNRNKNLDVNISYNQVNFNPSSTGQVRSGAITITNGSTSGSSSGTVNGQIYSNTIRVEGTESVGIGLYEFSNNTSDIAVSSNTLTGGETAAMYVSKGTGGGGFSTIDFVNNALYSNQIDDQFNGVFVENSAGFLDINAINNTVIGARDGFNFQESGTGDLLVNFYNNLVAFGDASILLNFYNIVDSGILFENNNNLFYENELFIDPDFVPGSNFIDTNPKIKSLSNARLKAGSPAIEAGNSVILFNYSDIPYIDADGLYRFKKGNPVNLNADVDIGAYETGDLRVLDTLNVSGSYINYFESDEINSQTSAKLQVTHNWNPNNFGGIYNDANFGVWRTGSSWTVFNQDLLDMNVGAAFNIWSPAPSQNNFNHTASVTSANNAYLDYSNLNNKPDQILSVTQIYGLYNDNPVGVDYDPFENQWVIGNTNLVDMPTNAQFNVYHQQPSANAFKHVAVAANISSNSTLIDHPLLNGTPCAQIQVTQATSNSNPHSTGVWYTGTKWAIYNQDQDPMTVNTRFHVIISAEQIEACNGDLIFADGFE